MTELDTRPRQTPAAYAAVLLGLADSNGRTTRRYRGRLHGGSPRPARQRLAPTLPCQQNDPELWFAEAPADLERAKTLCAACPVRLTCLAIAVDGQEYAGVWGGQIFDRGRIIPHKRPRGRPRKHHVTPKRGPLSRDENVVTGQTSAPHCAPQSRVDAALRKLHDAESALHTAHQSRVDASIIAANKALRDAVTEYLAATVT